MNAGTLMFLPLDQLEANEFALRGVDDTNPDVLRLFDNIREHGVLIPIRVRPQFEADKSTPKVTADGRPIYAVIDGLHRFTGASRARLDGVNCVIVNKGDADVEEEQIFANLHRIPTQPFEYGKHMKLILMRNPTMSVKQMAAKLNVSEEFIEKRMGLLRLHKDGVDSKGEPTSTLGKLVDSGRIPLGNAVELASILPTDKQLEFKDDAISMSHTLFAKKVSDWKAEQRKAKQEGRKPDERVGYTPSFHLRNKKDIEAEATSGTAVGQLIKAKGITDPVEAAKFALQWAGQLDEQSQTRLKAEWDAAEKARLAKKAASAQERAEKAAKEAKEAAERAGAATAAQ